MMNNVLNRKPLLIAILAMVMILPFQLNAFAAMSTTFQLKTSVLDQQITVTVTAANLQDMYAYDLILEYDPLRLELVEANSEIIGFSVAPIVNGSEIRFAHTKVGPTQGIDGTAPIATLTFERIRGGKTAIRLLDAKLVDSKDQMIHLQPGVQAEVTVDQVTATFTDISGHWAAEAILEASELGFVSGYPEGTFRPQQLVTRTEFTAMLVRALLIDTEQSELHEFSDGDALEAWAIPSIRAAVGSGWISGYEDGTFRGNNTIVRQEIAAIAMRALGDVAMQTEAHPNFADGADIQAWARGYVAAAVDAGLMQGKGNHLFAPLDHATRAEAVTVILNMLNTQTQ